MTNVPAALAINLASEADRQGGHLKRDIGGVGIAAIGRDAAVAELRESIAGGGHLKLAFCNANLVNIASGDAALQRSLAAFLVLPDGLGVDLGSRLLYGAPFPVNLNGTDFFPAFFAAEARPLRVALLGGRPGVAERAVAELLRRYPQHRFTVASHGYFAPEEEAGILGRLAADRPDLLLVAMGNPLQERFIARALDARHCAVAAGVGALFDFFAGEVPRAPELFRKARLEWVYRLWLEPRRLWRRYILGNPAFLVRMARQYLAARRQAGRVS